MGTPPAAGHSSLARAPQALIAAGLLVVSGLLAWGASGLPDAVGYSGVGPGVLPWFVATSIGVLAIVLIVQVVSGGLRDVEAGSGAPRGDWKAMAWVSAGILANAALLTRVGFVLGCTVCFVLAVRGMRVSEGKPGGGAMRVLGDAAVGMAISAPTYWLFTKLLGLNLPGITGTGWI